MSKEYALPKWKKGATHFTVGVNRNGKRGYQSTVPMPIMELLGNPDKITFVIKPKNRVEIVATSEKKSLEDTQ